MTSITQRQNAQSKTQVNASWSGDASKIAAWSKIDREMAPGSRMGCAWLAQTAPTTFLKGKEQPQTRAHWNDLAARWADACPRGQHPTRKSDPNPTIRRQARRDELMKALAARMMNMIAQHGVSIEDKHLVAQAVADCLLDRVNRVRREVDADEIERVEQKIGVAA